jgi:hypothetical protein
MKRIIYKDKKINGGENWINNRILGQMLNLKTS